MEREGQLHGAGTGGTVLEIQPEAHPGSAENEPSSSLVVPSIGQNGPILCDN